MANIWDARVQADPAGHFLQLNAWGELKRRHGWQRAQCDGVMLLRQLPLGLGRLAYAPRGPLLEWSANATAILAPAEAAARAAGAIALMIEPNVPDAPELAAALERAGYAPADAIQPRRTLLVDLKGDEAALLKRMKEKTRYNVRLSGRKGVTVRVIETAGSEADIDAFHGLYETTADRKAFGIHTRAYYADFMRLFAWDADSPHCAALLLAEHADHPDRALAGIIVTAVSGVGTYVYGASANTGRELMPTYALQWAGMQWARTRGCHTYDQWGVPDLDEAELEAGVDTRSDGMWGVYRTKRGYGGTLMRTPGVWVKVFSPLRWRAFALARRLQKSSIAG